MGPESAGGLPAGSESGGRLRATSRSEVFVFRCDSCGTVVPAGVREHKIVVETRPKRYEARGSSRETFRGPRHRGPIGRRARRQRSFDKGGEGTEIVREISVCPKCAENHAAEAAQVMAEVGAAS